MNRLPIRVRLTTAFGLAMLLMLVSAASFVYLRLRADLDDRVDASLNARSEALAETEREPSLRGVALEDPEESFAQLLSTDGEVLESSGTLKTAALSPAEAERAVTETVVLEREFAGVDGSARVVARAGGPRARTIVVVGQSLVDRNDALANVAMSFVVGGSVATLFACLIGYVLAARALAPVESMRRRAREVSLRATDEGLPLPAAHDEIRRLGETLNEMLNRLRAAFERESRFVADASHELRTPIAIIKTELEGALRTVPSDSPVHAALVAAHEECDRLAQLAEDLLLIARSADGELPLTPIPLAAADLLRGVRERFADRAARRGRAIRVEADLYLWVWADPIRVPQALGNLVENALRHGSGEVVLAAHGSDGGVEIDVSDEGPGFPGSLGPRAFERFARGDQARGGGGVGLGLAIVQAIALAHGGHVEVVDGAATTVRLTLPKSV